MKDATLEALTRGQSRGSGYAGLHGRSNRGSRTAATDRPASRRDLPAARMAPQAGPRGGGGMNYHPPYDDDRTNKADKIFDAAQIPR